MPRPLQWIYLASGLVAVFLATTPEQRAQTRDTAMDNQIHHRTASVDGLNIVYREAGPKDAPTLVLLHGVPLSS